MTSNALNNLNLPTVISLFGRPGSGKSTALAYLIGYFKQNKGAKNCVVFSGTAFNGFFDKYVTAKFVHSWDPKILAKRLEDVKRQYLSLSPEKRKEHHTIFVLDDLVGAANWKSSIMQHLFTSHRHYGITILVSSQYPNSISPLIRECSKLAIIFNQTTKRSIEPLFQSYGSHFNSLKEFTDYISQLPRYCFLLVQTDEYDRAKKYIKTKVPNGKLKFFYTNSS